MESTGVLQLLEQLDDEIDGLEDILSPVLGNALSPTLSKLPVLDKAKLYVLMTYAIESILFSYLRLNGIKAREHPVFKELTRVKQYFDKIKDAETPVTKRENISIDKPAAGRILKAALSGNDRYDLERAERMAKERARAHLKSMDLTRRQEARTHIRFDRPEEKQEFESGHDNAQVDMSSNSELDFVASSDLEGKVGTTSIEKRKFESSSSTHLQDAMTRPDEGLDIGPETPDAKRKKSNGMKNKAVEKRKKSQKSKDKSRAV